MTSNSTADTEAAGNVQASGPGITCSVTGIASRPSTSSCESAAIWNTLPAVHRGDRQCEGLTWETVSMQRCNQLLFAGSLLLCAWYGMMATHESGHVIGALATGGTVTRVVLHPLAISRTDVAPNPHPGVVVWSGPIVGCVLPLCLFFGVPRAWVVLRRVAGFFAGFCLVANGTYIGVGVWDAVGDCREMLQTGTPQWVMVLFGIVAVASGLALWHRLGSLREFVRDPSLVNPRWATSVCWVLVVYLVAAAVLSGR